MGTTFPGGNSLARPGDAPNPMTQGGIAAQLVTSTANDKFSDRSTPAPDRYRAGKPALPARR
ncbi:hypothetical protein, partial [Phyllobacterium sp. P5_D12]